jgi:hypothetical protein
VTDLREALLFSDGSMTVFAPGTPMERIRSERAEGDRNEPRDKWTKILMISIEQHEIVYDPAAEEPAPMSEVEQLRAENKRLKAALDTIAETGAGQDGEAGR